MEFILEEGKHLHDECSTLILPGLSIGNVGQLAMDLLVSSMGAERIGYLDDPFVLPCVGNDAYGPVPRGDLALPLEAYDSPSNALTIVQQRSPVVKGMMVEFAKNLADFAAASGKKHIIVLSSLDSGRRQKIEISSGLQMYYLSSANADGTDGDCEKLGWKKLQEYNPAQRRWKYLSSLAEGNVMQEDSLSFEDELVDEDYYPSLPFAALFSCCKAKGLKVTCILCYCSEGDNIPESFQLAEAACKLLGLNTTKFQGIAVNPDLKARVLNLLASTAWSIWKARNSSVFQGVPVDPLHSIRQAVHLVDKVARGCPSQTRSRAPFDGRPARLSPWRPPSSWLHLNVDGLSLQDGRFAGCGGIACDVRGRILGGFGLALRGGSPLVAEAEAIQTGIRWALSQGWNQVVVFSDCLGLVSSIVEINPMVHWEIQVVAEDIRVILSQEPTVRISFIPRKENAFVHRLATVGLRQGG
ncbi:hypothetical protein HHK36_009995 [Tetracentron sinense]|uniref:Proteasome assembly chaperone 2 n=1 Tax=Tetracentron sinense TaxID=13715 RepID=A0A834ZMM0_TETSI|nr:hypothetical protein HHK36_009995 [Tetracentron sinense]